MKLEERGGEEGRCQWLGKTSLCECDRGERADSVCSRVQDNITGCGVSEFPKGGIS